MAYRRGPARHDVAACGDTRARPLTRPGRSVITDVGPCRREGMTGLQHVLPGLVQLQVLILAVGAHRVAVPDVPFPKVGIPVIVNRGLDVRHDSTAEPAAEHRLTPIQLTGTAIVTPLRQVT